MIQGRTGTTPQAFTNPLFFDSMIRIISSFCLATIALISVSCCCTGEAGAPPLRPLTKFREIETTSTSTVEVLNEK
jgi:hypothetical protein